MDENDGHRVSIGILCFNQGDLIADVIASAQRQTRPADEILVVDDGSTDDSVEVVRRSAGVRLVEHGTNRGRAAARTTLLEAADGDLLVYLDGDTLAAPDLVEQLLPEYADPEVAAVGGVVDETLLVTVWDRWRARHGTSRDASAPDRDAKVLYGWALSCRREAVLAVGGFRPGSEDIDLSIRLRTPTTRLVLQPAARVLHRRSDDWRGIRGYAYRLSFGAYVAFARNGDPRLGPHLRRLLRRTMAQLRRDLFIEREPAIAAVTLALLPTSVLGLLRGRRYVAGRLATSAIPPGL